MERQREANRLAVERTQSRLAAGQAAGPAASENKPTPAQKSTPTQTAKPAEQEDRARKEEVGRGEAGQGGSGDETQAALTGDADRRRGAAPRRRHRRPDRHRRLRGRRRGAGAAGTGAGRRLDPVAGCIPATRAAAERRPSSSASRPSRPRTRPASAAPTRPATRPGSRSPPIRRRAARSRPAAVTLVGEDDWQAGVAASVLMADPVGAPVLVSGGDEVPAITSQALDALQPEGGNASGGAQVFALGGVAAPDDLDTRRLDATDPAAAAEAIDRLRSELVGEEPKHIVLTTSEQAGFAMPAAAWAARSGDPVLFATRDQLPKPTAKALKRHEDARVYVLGPSSAISSRGRPQGRQDLQAGPPGGRRGPGHQLDRLRPLRRRQLRLEHQRPGPWLRRRPQRPPAGRRRGRAALGQRHLGPAAPHRQRRYASPARCAATCSTSSRATAPTRPAPSTTTSG